MLGQPYHVSESTPHTALDLPRPILADRIMRDLYERAKIVAGSDSHVLIWGGPGVGKKTLAREIHVHSARRDGPFVERCPIAIPDHLVDSHLHGWAAGPTSDRITPVGPGALESASEGTLLLTYLGEMPMASQALLARALCERRVTRFGEGTSRAIDVRIIATELVEPRPQSEGGQIHDDLFAVFTETTFRVPRLGERPNEVRALAQDFLANIEIDGIRRNLKCSAAALDHLATRAWSGGIRELHCRLVDAMYGCEDEELQVKHFDFDYAL
jgi:DNA-binding NtrC family response regulator